jgi:hypothetical protein
LHQNKKVTNFAEHFSFSLESDRRIYFGMLTDRLVNQREKTSSERGWKDKLTDRFVKRMKRPADRQVRKKDEEASREDKKASWRTGSGRGWKDKLIRQVREEDEKASWQTGSGRGWKGKLTDRLTNSMETHWERGLCTGWKDKLTDRLVRMTDKLRDRLVNRMKGHI